MPPVRPADLVVTQSPDTTGSTGPMPPIRPANFVAMLAPETSEEGAKTFALTRGVDLVADVLHDRLPKVITRGVAPPQVHALALTEAPASPTADALLARAAELNAPLPPMPIPNVGPPKPQAKEPAASGRQSAVVSGDEVKRLLGSLPLDAFKPAPSASGAGLRGAQQ